MVSASVRTVVQYPNDLVCNLLFAVYLRTLCCAQTVYSFFHVTIDLDFSKSVVCNGIIITLPVSPHTHTHYDVVSGRLLCRIVSL